MSSLSLSRLVVPLSVLVVLLTNGNAWAGDPVADIWHTDGYAFDPATDDCDPGGTDICSVNGATGGMECKAERYTSSNQGAVMHMIRNESNTGS